MATYSGEAGRCVTGDANELKTCGYQRVEDWCKYCSYASEYADVCATVGVSISSSGKTQQEPPAPGDDRGATGSDMATELAHRQRQERAFRIAAIALGVLAGLCVVMLVAAVVIGRRLPAIAGCGSQRRSSGSGSSSAMDDSTLLQLGTNGLGQPEKQSDFVDCFLAVVGKMRKVIHPFFARREDEISLQSGDTVTIQMAFDDGWVVGKNLTSGLEGTFPLMCIMDNLPPSLPAHWSVLPESKSASIDNIRGSSRSITRPTPRVSCAGGGVRSGSVPPHAPVITSTDIPSSPRLHSTRHSARIIRRTSEERARQAGGVSLFGRLLGALSPTRPAASSQQPGFFKRLLFAPTPASDLGGPLEISGPIPTRPHSFTVHSAVHVGLNNPGYAPADGEQSTWISTVPVGVPSDNRYPVMNGHGSASYHNDIGRTSADRLPAAPMNPSQGFGEFALGNGSQLTVGGNPSMDTYRTAEQSATGIAGQPLSAATGAYRR
ncbi:hypothetical protein H4R19_001789 [Coemansia spiralis]|nr:hypothetical protein H4R19_001789 [Coemansia spiralis]